ncbi:phosphoglycerate mutase family protein [Cystoisospora suis]|uniref:Phosphoglycerate mutase family protein n=1 Tax=Cystoisospora suis TaxID=483139 RepID=A0A2C6L952_9APIC|nr:phosphoglycerate mutase family protein [Cystoisospora suis]
MNAILFIFTAVLGAQYHRLTDGRGCHAVPVVFPEEVCTSVSLSDQNGGKMCPHNVAKQTPRLFWKRCCFSCLARHARCQRGRPTRSTGYRSGGQPSMLSATPSLIPRKEVTLCGSCRGLSRNWLCLTSDPPPCLLQLTVATSARPCRRRLKFGEKDGGGAFLPSTVRNPNGPYDGPFGFLTRFLLPSVGAVPRSCTLFGAGKHNGHTTPSPVSARCSSTARPSRTDAQLRADSLGHTKGTKPRVLSETAAGSGAGITGQIAGQLGERELTRYGALSEKECYQNGRTGKSDRKSTVILITKSGPSLLQTNLAGDDAADGAQGGAHTKKGIERTDGGDPPSVFSSVMPTSRLAPAPDRLRRGGLQELQRLAAGFVSTCGKAFRKHGRRVGSPQQMISVLTNWLAENQQSMREGKKKILLLMRHGESEFNEWRRSSFTHLRFSDMIRYDPEMVDVCLTKTGLKQCQGASEYYRAVRAAIPSFHIDSYLVSPLSRAVQTALNTFGCPTSSEDIASDSSERNAEGRSSDRWILTPLLTERTDTTGDVGRDANSLMEFLKMKRRVGEIPPECNPERVLDWTLVRPVNKWWLQLSDEELTAAEKMLAEPWLPVVGDSQQHIPSGTPGGKEDSESVRSQVVRSIKSTFSLVDEAAREAAWKRRMQGSYRYRRVPLETDECVLARARLLLKALCKVKDARVVLMVGHSIFFRILTNTPKMANAEILPYELDCEAKAIKELRTLEL